jgi:signal transduction histidine kinase
VTAAGRRRLAALGLVLTACCAVGQLVITFTTSATQAPNRAAAVLGGLGLLLWSSVGTVIVRKTGNPIGWFFLGIGLSTALGFFGDDYASASYRNGPVPLLPGTDWVALLSSVGIIAPMLLPLLFLLFPTGGPPSPRWRLVLLPWMTGAILILAWAFLRPGDIAGCIDPASCPMIYSVPNPIGLPLPGALTDLIQVLSVSLLLLSAALAIASLVVRYRRSGGIERQQLKWILLVGLLLAVLFTVMAVVQSMLPGEADQLDWLWNAFILLLLVGIPVAAAFAILRYRLYDIDVVISKTLVYGGLAVLIGVVYVGIVVVVGQAIGAGTDQAALRIGATALIALAFEPARSRLQRWANRLVYGSRATPYEVMSEFGRRMAEVPSAEVVLRDMAEAARAGVGASAATVSVVLPDGLRSVTVPDDGPGGDIETDIDVMHAGQSVGTLSVVKPQNEPLRPAERSLLHDLAGHAGLALHNVRLTEELRQRVEELAAQTDELNRSRQRIVAARDAQRRRLEHELRDGVASDLAAIQTALLADAELVTSDPEAVVESIDELGGRANAALEELRDVARGIFPPLLADKGLAAALESHIRKMGLDAAIRIDPMVADTRFDPSVENAVYFCCVQALQNAQRHATSAHVDVELDRDAEDLRFVVMDRGPGFDPATIRGGEGMQIMRDRVAALDGVLDINSKPGAGTMVTGRVPVRHLEAVTP